MAEFIPDGKYTVEVTLSGGSGRASIASPTQITVEDGQMQAEIEWSSSHYDYMSVGGKAYYPVNQDGNSTFVIEVNELDTDIPIEAETLAMSQPHTVEYTLHFDSSTLKAEGFQGSALMFGGIGILIAFAAAATALLLRRKRAK